MSDATPEQQVRITKENHHRIAWLPEMACKVGRQLPGLKEWRVAEVWHAKRKRVDDYWVYEP